MTDLRKLVLYTYWRSSCAYRVRFALAAKKLPYESAFVNLLEGAQSRAEHVARNPMGHVPCLVVDGKIFTESVAILELLDELFPEPPLYPREPFGRARVRAMVELVNSGIQPMQNLRVLARVSPDAEARKEWVRPFIEHGLGAFEALMAANEKEGVRGRYAYGDALSAADACLVPQLYAARRFKIDLAPFPRVVAAGEAAAATDAGKAALPENQPDAAP